MTEEIRKKRRRRIRRRSHLEEPPPVIDQAAVEGWLHSIGAQWSAAGICVLLLAAVAIAFVGTIQAGFINPGDDVFVTFNPLVINGFSLKSIMLAFNPSHAAGGLYAPLATISHMVDHGDAPTRYHLTNVLLHAAATVLLFLGLRDMTASTWRSGFVAMAFAVHPLHVESVAWIAERHAALGGVFLALVLPLYVRLVYRPWSYARYAAVVALAVLGMFADPALAALPVVLLVLDFWPLGRLAQPAFADANSPFSRNAWSHIPRLFLEKIPMLACSAVVFGMSILAQGQLKYLPGTVSFARHAADLAASQVAYLASTLLSVAGIAPFYTASAGAGSASGALAGLVLVAVVTVAAFALYKKCPYLPAGWLWYLAMLAPAVGWKGGAQPTDLVRHAYLARIGLYIIIAWGGWDVCRLLPARKWLAAAAITFGAVAMVVVSEMTASYWLDNETFWNHRVGSNPDNYRDRIFLGVALAQNGKLKDAVEQLQKALELKPDSAEACFNLGNTFVMEGSLQEAIGQYKKALELEPAYADACIGLGVALNNSGSPDDAIPFFQKALQINPALADAYMNLGISYARKNDLENAEANYRKALEIRPRYAEAFYNIGVAHAQRNDFDTAIANYYKALEIQPAYAEAWYNLGVAYYRKDDVDEATKDWRKALEIRGTYEEAHYNLAISLAKAGNLDEAIAHYKKALEIGPNYTEIYNNLGTAYQQKREYGEAIASFEKAVQISPDYLLARNNLAMVLATCADKTYRNGLRAVDLVLEPSKIVAGGNDPILLRTLAAAYAETGRFAEAAQTARKALENCDPKTNRVVAGKLRDEIKLYENGTPYHEMQ